MYAQLGDIIFETLIGPSTYQRSGEKKYGIHELVDVKPRIQSTGLALLKIEMSISLFDAFCNPEAEIKALEDHMNAGHVLPFILGTGRYIGDFVITNFSESVQHAYADGGMREVHFNISLMEAVVQIDKSKQSSMSASALESNSPQVARGILKSYQTPEGQITTDTVFAVATTKEIDTALKKEKSLGAFSAQNIDKVTKLVDKMNAYVGNTLNILNGNSDLLGVIPNMPANLSSAITAAFNLKQSLGTSVGLSLGYSNTLQSAMAAAKQSGSSLIGRYLFRFR